MPRPIESSPMIANGPTGMSPPNSSAHIVSTHGTASPRAAQAVAYVEWVCTTPPTRGHLAIDVGLRLGVGRRSVLALHDPALEVADDHVLRRQVVVGDAAGLDHQQVVTGDACGDVAGRPHHEPVADQLARAARTPHGAGR